MGFEAAMKDDAEDSAAIREVSATDAAAVAAIYNHFVLTTVVTFEEQPVSAAEMWRRIEEIRSSSMPWLVAELGDHVVGYACAAPWKSRSGYRFAAETTVYVAPGHEGRGIGSALYDALFPALRARGIHAVMGGIALPNDASVALHEKFGMEKVAHFRETGFKFGRWIDVGYWERVLDA